MNTLEIYSSPAPPDGSVTNATRRICTPCHHGAPIVQNAPEISSPNSRIPAIVSFEIHDRTPPSPTGASPQRRPLTGLKLKMTLLLTLWWVLLPFRPIVKAETPPLQERRYSVRYRAPEWLASRIQSLLTPSGHIKLEPARKLLIITDHPDSLKRIETTLQRLDLPIRDIEVVIQILQGRREARAPQKESVELPDVIKKMRSFLKFEHYSLLERGFIRTVEFKPTVMILGDYRLSFTGEWAVEPRDVIRLVDLTLEHKTKKTNKTSSGYTRILTTTLNLRAGEPTVVGTARSETSPSILFLVLQVRLVSPGGS